MVELSAAEAEQIIEYTGLDLVLELPHWVVIPVVFFSRDKTGLARIVTIMRKDPISSPSY